MKSFSDQNSGENKLGTFIKWLWGKKLYRILFGGLIGAGAGWLYWEFIGCNGGSCPLTSNAPQTIFIFTLFGVWFNYRK